MNRILAAAIAVLLSQLLALAPATAGELPQKAISVEDGIVAVRAGVAPNPDAPAPLPIGKLKHPTRYFVDLVNESPYPVWLDATWSFPDGRDGKVTTSKVRQGDKVPPGGSYWFYADKLGVIVDRRIVVDIAVWADEKRTRRIGGQTAELEFAQADVDVFIASFPSAFKNPPKGATPLVISGWRDLPKPLSDVPGTAADAVLQKDIQHTLWKFDSAKRFTCERTIVDAMPISVDDSIMVSRMDDNAKARIRDEQDTGMLTLERWRARSCDQDVAYEVMLSNSSKGGTDVILLEITDQSVPPAAADVVEAN